MNDRELIVSYVLGELEPRERADLELRLEGDPALRVELDEVRLIASDLEQLPDEGWPSEADERTGRESDRRPSASRSPLRLGIAALGGRSGAGDRRRDRHDPHGRGWANRPGWPTGSARAASARDQWVSSCSDAGA